MALYAPISVRIGLQTAKAFATDPGSSGCRIALGEIDVNKMDETSLQLPVEHDLIVIGKRISDSDIGEDHHAKRARFDVQSNDEMLCQLTKRVEYLTQKQARMQARLCRTESISIATCISDLYAVGLDLLDSLLQEELQSALDKEEISLVDCVGEGNPFKAQDAANITYTQALFYRGSSCKVKIIMNRTHKKFSEMVAGFGEEEVEPSFKYYIEVVKPLRNDAAHPLSIYKRKSYPPGARKFKPINLLIDPRLTIADLRRKYIIVQDCQDSLLNPEAAETDWDSSLFDKVQELPRLQELINWYVAELGRCVLHKVQGWGNTCGSDQQLDKIKMVAGHFYYKDWLLSSDFLHYWDQEQWLEWIPLWLLMED